MKKNLSRQFTKEKSMKLNETVELMNSNDWKDRVKAEYYQIEQRCNNLAKMIIDYKNNELSFSPITPIEILQGQLLNMLMYKAQLEYRCAIECIDIFTKEKENGKASKE